MIKVLIADDQQFIRQSLKIVLDSMKRFEVVGMAGDGYEVLDGIRASNPDIVLMDIQMPKMDGVECTKLIKLKYPSVKIIILTTFDDDEYVYNALRYGASGYLLKGVDMNELGNAIETVYNGQAMINPDIASKVLSMFSQMAQDGKGMSFEARHSETLTASEWKIIREIEKGASNKEIADRLCLSEGTVRNYLSTILDKLDLRDRTQLAIWAVQTTLQV